MAIGQAPLELALRCGCGHEGTRGSPWGRKNSQLYTEWGDYAGYKCGLRLTLRSNAAQHPVAFILCRDQGLGRTAATRDQLLNYSLPFRNRGSCSFTTNVADARPPG